MALPSAPFFRRCEMTLVETLETLTARTPSGGGFWLGNNYLLVR